MTQISYQLYSSREFSPLPDTLAMLKSLGYGQVEGFGGVYNDIDALASALDRSGLAMPSGHFGIDMLENDPDRVFAIARATGMQMVICPFLTEPQRPGDAEGWRAFGARLEKAGAPFRDAGFVVGWHNHHFEFQPLADGTIPLENIFEGGPSLAWEADIAWIVRGNADPHAWIARYADRIRAVHVKDIAPAGDNLDEDGWADVGHGTLDWKGFVAALRKTRAELFIMEHDKPNDDRRFASRSIATLKPLVE
jgi:sugar phosphate isomerase/epimerase